MGSVSEGITGTVGVVGSKLSEVCGVSGRGCRWAWQSGRAGDLGRGFQTALTRVGMKENFFAARSRAFWAVWASFRGERCDHAGCLRTSHHPAQPCTVALLYVS